MTHSPAMTGPRAGAPFDLSRRTMLAGSAALLSIGARGAPGLPPGLFRLGVASGDPTAGGAVL